MTDVCTNCEVLKHEIEELKNHICTLDQENTQQHARNQRLEAELEEAKRYHNVSYNQIKESFLR